jgi:hypothetical protein
VVSRRSLRPGDFTGGLADARSESRWDRHRHALTRTH